MKGSKDIKLGNILVLVREGQKSVIIRFKRKVKEEERSNDDQVDGKVLYFFAFLLPFISS